MYYYNIYKNNLFLCKMRITKTSLILILLFINISLYSKEKVVVYDINDLFQDTLKYNPKINSSLASIYAAEGDKLQASMTYNPSIALEIENFGGNKEYSGFKEAEYTLAIKKQIEIAGKRDFRMQISDYNLLIMRKEQIIKILQLLLEVQISAIRYHFAQNRLEIIEQQLSLSNKAYNSIEHRVKAAATSEIQLDKIDIEKNRIGLKKIKLKKIIETAKAKLVKAVGRNLTEFKINDKNLQILPSLAAMPELLLKAKSTLQFQKVQLEQLKARSNIELQKAKAIEDPKFGLGVRKLGNTGSNGFVAYGSIPISIFNNNQGGIDRASAELALAKSRIFEEIQLIETKIKTTFLEFNSLRTEVLNYKKNIIPLTEKVYKQTLTGYANGRFSELDLIDSQRVFFEIQEEQIMVLEKLYISKAYMDFLLNKNFNVLRHIDNLNIRGVSG